MTDVPQSWRSRRVRSYTLTKGRARTRYQLLVETMISVPSDGYDAQSADSLLPESKAIYEHARRPVSMAELSALLTIPLGVIRVLVSELADSGLILVHPTGHTYRYDKNVLERVLDGLDKLDA